MNEQLNVPSFRSMSSAARERRRRQLVEYVATVAPSRNRALLVPAIALVAAAVLAAAAYGAYSLTRVPSHQQLLSVGCYANASLDARTAIVQSQPNNSPAETCAANWPSAFPGQQQPTAFGTCLLDSGAIAVFPATDEASCDKLGLATFSGQEAAAAEAARAAAVVAEVQQEVNASDCLSSDDARQRVETTLAEHGFNDWRVTVADGQGFPAAQCATASIDPPNKTITIGPS